MEEYKLLLILKDNFPQKRNIDLIFFVRELYKLSKRFARYNVLNCNTRLTKIQKATWDKIDKKIKNMCLYMGVKCDTNGDPRGYSVKIELPNGESNELGGLWGIA